VDFGSMFAVGNDWLELAVGTNAAGSFTTLVPRQRLNATPYAVYAESANATNFVGAVPAAHLAGAALLAGGNTFAGNQIINPGNVGIGTATPNFPLSLPDTVGDKISLYGQLPNHYGFGVSNSLLQIYADQLSSDIAFGYGQSADLTETMRVKGNGRVGIGTNNTAATLDVNGTINASGFTGDGSGLTNVALLAAPNQTFTGSNRFTGALLIGTNDVVASSENSGLRMISGIVNADGSIAAGTNFTVQPVGSGLYMVQFFRLVPSAVLLSTPAVTVTVQSTNSVANGTGFNTYSAQILTQSSIYFLVQISVINYEPVGTTFGLVSLVVANPAPSSGFSFNFTAIGPRGPGSFLQF
jgi:hypothetical protein